MKLTLINIPASEPVTQGSVLSQIRSDVDSFVDSLDWLDSLITASRERAEQITRRALMPQTWELTLNGFPYGVINLPLPPLQTVDSIKYIDVDGVEQTLSSLSYRVLTGGEPGGVQPIYSSSWPATLSDMETVKIRFTCGYAFPNFDSSLIYNKSQVVNYLGANYTCILKTTAGTLPTDTTHWASTDPSINNVPKAIKQWIMINVANLLENRESQGVATGRSTVFNLDATLCDGLLESFRMTRL